MAKTVIVFDPVFPNAAPTRIRISDAGADAIIATGDAVLAFGEVAASAPVVPGVGMYDFQDPAQSSLV